ncbi:hypothetical protein QR46_2678 [Giardia duodenalis assemblage B]|uniref:phosphomevalonate kinase n=1 Tax=Giardia duodenalis assemblage B TaxID=1394984 RepID=A0A132NTD6_GIAIN|nr:hypothetical protein QR46_2678 [Giardia intestinalis assemblage B]
MRFCGKTLAVGGYAVLAPAGCGLALPVKSAAMDITVSIRPGYREATTLVLSRNGSPDTAEIPIENTDFYSASDPGSAFAHAACLTLLAYSDATYDRLEITVRTSETKPPGAKLGIGSSAMITVGTIAGLAECIDVRLEEAELFVLSHFSCLLVQGQSSGYDVASVMSQTPIIYKQNGQYHASIYRLAHAARSGSRLSFLVSQLRALACGDVLPSILPVSLPQFHFYLLKSQQQLDKDTSTAKELQRLAPTYANTQSYEQLIKTSATLINALTTRESSIECIKKEIQEYRAAQRSFSAENGVEIEPKEISDLIESLSANSIVVGAMCVGAGGYDAFLCITTSVIAEGTFMGFLVVNITL